jgi:hypothetical protein
VSDPEAIAAVQAATRDAELLIADGHHRYETMRTYAEEIGGDGEHNYILMCLVALEDPGLTVFPTHRLVGNLDDQRRASLFQAGARARLRHRRGPRRADRARRPAEGPCSSATSTGATNRALRLTLKDQAIADAALPARSEAYRHLDTGVLETLLLKNALGLSDEDISHFNGLFYARDTAEALEMVRSGELRRGLLHAPHARRAGSRRGGGGREHAAQVHLLLPKAAHRPAVQPPVLAGPGDIIAGEGSRID